MTPQTDRALLERIDERTEQMAGYLEAVDQRLKVVEGRLFVGNGTPPVLSRLERAEEAIKGLEHETDRPHRNCPWEAVQKKFLAWAVAAVALALLALVTGNAGLVAKVFAEVIK